MEMTYRTQTEISLFGQQLENIYVFIFLFIRITFYTDATVTSVQ